MNIPMPYIEAVPAAYAAATAALYTILPLVGGWESEVYCDGRRRGRRRLGGKFKWTRKSKRAW